MLMRKSLFIVTIALALSACVSNQQGGAVLGGAAGAVLGNTVGKGSGKTIATVGGAILGTILGAKVGENMDKPKETIVIREYHEAPRPRDNHSRDECFAYKKNEGAYSSCKRGVSVRLQREQQALERDAYRAGTKGAERKY
jgi:uncharacterized protein YcfJ